MGVWGWVGVKQAGVGGGCGAWGEASGGRREGRRGRGLGNSLMARLGIAAGCRFKSRFKRQACAPLSRLLRARCWAFAPPHPPALLWCRFDHIWGIFLTAAGRRRRADLMLVPRPQWAFALHGWTGSRQYCRFVRRYTVQLG